jgi:hypothetical protein
MKCLILIFGLLIQALSLTNWFHFQICLSAISTLLFQRDHKFLHNLRNHNSLAPLFLVTALTLLLSSIYHCTLWTPKSWLNILFGFVELAVLVGIAPLVYFFLQTMWHKENLPNYIDRAVVFLAPVSFLLFFVWSSYSSICFALYIIFTGMWTVNQVSSSQQ